MANWLCQLNIKPAKPPIFGKTVGAKKLIFGYLESTKIAQNSGYRENVFFENGFASLTDVTQVLGTVKHETSKSEWVKRNIPRT